jgi:hypothetical protein
MSLRDSNVVNPARKKRVAIVIANPSTSTTTGWPVGFWWSELTHAYYVLTENAYELEVFSPNGGRCKPDALSDPRDPSGYSAGDLITMGFIATPSCAALVENTRPTTDIDVEHFDAILVAGGQAPMFTFETATNLHRAFVEFYERGKAAVALCHGSRSSSPWPLTAEYVVHPRLEFTALIAQPPLHRHGAIAVRFDLAHGVQVILEASRSNEGECASVDLAFIAIAVFGKRPVITEEDDAKLLRVSVIKPIVDARLSRLVTKDSVVGLHEKVAPVEPAKLFDAGDGNTWSKNAVVGLRSRLPPAEQRFEALELR